MYALDVDFNLYAWGSNDKGQCGLGNMEQSNIPRKIEILAKKWVSSVTSFFFSVEI